jgi:hypothetical protein
MKRSVEAREAVASSTMHTIRLIELSAAVAVTHAQQRAAASIASGCVPNARHSLELRPGLPRDKRGAVRVFEFVSRNPAMFPIATVPRVLGVSKSGYHAWCRRRRPSTHALRRAARSCSSMPEGTTR